MAKSIPGKTCQHGPLDRVDNFLSESSSRNELLTVLNIHQAIKLSKHVCVSDSIVECIPNDHPEIIGKSAKKKFVNEKELEQWYEGIISSYNVISGKYFVYFLYDGVTEETSYDDKDVEIID